MSKYFGYCRVSTQTQSEHGYGLAAQDEAIRKYAQENGLELAGMYRDEGISGNLNDTAEDDEISKREALVDMLASLEAGDTVIVLNTSRLWRSDMTRALVKRELMKREAKVISIEQPKFDLYNKDPNDYLINSLMEALDVYERMSISLKLARGRTVKAKGGDKPAGLCPYGYKYSGDKKSIVTDPDEVAAVRLMFTEGQKGKTLQQICDILDGKGIKPRRGGNWSRGSVQAILRNRFYLGELQHQGKTIKGNHEPIISAVQFGKVNKQLIRRHK